MKKLYLLSLGILFSCYSIAQIDPFASPSDKTKPSNDKLTPRSTNTTTITTPNTVDKLGKEAFYKAFAEKKLPLTLDVGSVEAAQKLIKTEKLVALSIDEMEQFFPIPQLQISNGPQLARTYYALGYVRLSQYAEVFLCLEDWTTDTKNHHWHIHAYSFSNRTTFIDDVLLSFASKEEDGRATQKAVFNSGFTIAMSRETERTLNQYDAPTTYKASFQEEIRIDSKGKLSKRIEKTFTGTCIYRYDDNQRPEIVKREGKTWWGDHYRDAFGEHYAIISYNPLDSTNQNTSNVALQIHFYHYTKPKGATKFAMQHQAVEQTKDCNLDIQHFFNVPRPIILTDVDKNGILEASALYWLDCRNTDAASIQMLLTLWTGKYETHLPATVDLKTGTQTSFFNQYWGEIPESITTFARKLMNKHASKTKMK